MTEIKDRFEIGIHGLNEDMEDFIFEQDDYYFEHKTKFWSSFWKVCSDMLSNGVDLSYKQLKIIYREYNKGIIKKLVTIKELKISKYTIHLTKKTKLWCQLQYKNHKKGCPNYNKNPLCPPNSPYFKNFIDNYKYFYLIYAVFNFKKYKELKKLENPNRTDAQISCVLYWQGSIKKLLKEKIKFIYVTNFVDPNNFYLFGCGSGFNDKLLKILQNTIYSMESVGIDVFRTLRNNDIDFELKPVDKVLLVCLLCSKIDLRSRNDGLF